MTWTLMNGLLIATSFAPCLPQIDEVAHQATLFRVGVLVTGAGGVSQFAAEAAGAAELSAHFTTHSCSEGNGDKGLGLVSTLPISALWW
jgi:hypothetical protein